MCMNTHKVKNSWTTWMNYAYISCRAMTDIIWASWFIWSGNQLFMPMHYFMELVIHRTSVSQNTVKKIYPTGMNHWNFQKSEHSVMEMSDQKETVVSHVPLGIRLRIFRHSLPLVPFHNLFPSQMPLIFLLGSVLLAPYPLFLYSLCLNPSPMS